MNRRLIPYLAGFILVCWGPATAQAPGSEAALDRIATEVRLLRQVLEKQVAQTAKLEMARLRSARLLELEKRLAQLDDEAASEGHALRELSLTRNDQPAEDQPGVDVNIRATTQRIEEIVRRQAELRSHLATAEKSLAVELEVAAVR